MADDELKDQEPKDQEPLESALTQPSAVAKTRQPYGRLQRELTDEELKSPIVQRVLLYEKEKLEVEVSELKVYRERFHDMDKDNAVLKQVAKKSVASEVVFGVCLSVGAAALGYVPSVWANQPSGYICLAFGVILIVGGIVARLVER